MKIAGNKKKSKNLDTVESSTLEEKKNNNFSSKFLNKKSGITMVALVVTTIFSYDENVKSSNNKGFLLQTI